MISIRLCSRSLFNIASLLSRNEFLLVLMEDVYLLVQVTWQIVIFFCSHGELCINDQNNGDSGNMICYV